MPVEQAPSQQAPRPRNDAQVVRYHDYIDEKIESTRRAVKLVDLATALVELTVAFLLFLLLAVVVEHWIVRGGFPVLIRAGLFTVLAVGTSYFAYRRLWPLCVRAINPVYAAHTIEHSTPTLKNGLINLLLFRQHRQEISDAVYHTLEEQAAHGLTRAPVDTAVDRSELIHLGYVLIATVAVAALYKVLSPKDPFVAVERVLMPWADIVPASRVVISDIQPGSLTIARGEPIDVSAEIRGLEEDEVAVLRYTTEDGQIVGRALPLKVSNDGLRFTCRLADDAASTGASAGTGITRNLTYRLEAGDARSLDYRVTVVPAASILVERVDYHYPAYTGYLDHSAEGVGDIRAIEGTRVTVHARANGPIREANVDFDADGRSDLKMTNADTQSHVTFDVALRKDRQTPTHASYVLRFTNDEGRTNRNPVKHSINVDPDLLPETEIRSPREKLRDVRLDEQVTIEVEARDPDFALGAVRLRGQAMGRDVVNEALLKGEHRGKFNGRYVVNPKALGLHAGDVLEYWAEADDNRTPKPSTVATEHKSLRIVSPDPAQQPPPDQIAKNDRQQPRGEEGEKGRGEEGEKGRQGDKGTGRPGDKEAGESASASGDAGKQNDPNKSSESKQNQSGDGQAGQGEQGDKSSQDGDSSLKGGDQSKGGKPSAENSRQPNEDKKTDQDKQTGAGSAGGESSQDGPQPRGTPPAGNQGQQPANNEQGQNQKSNGQPQGGDRKPRAGEQESPVSSQGDNDAEVFDRIQKRLEEKDELKREEGAEEKSKKGERGRGGDSESEKQGDKKTGESASADGKREDKRGEGASQGENAQQKTEERSDGQGASARSDDLKQKNDAKSAPQDQQKSPGGDQTSSKGTPGAGDEQKSQGSPNSQDGMKPTEKPEHAGSKEGESKQQESPAGANSKRESDSHGEQGGDKAGGGEEGGGQKSPHDGTSSAGANQSADEGAGQSGEKGKGENSSDAGADTKSKDRTGAGDGKTAGKGSEQRDGTGDKQRSQPGDPPNEPFSRDAKRNADDEQRGGEGEKGRGGEEQRQGDRETGRQGDKPGESTSAEAEAKGTEAKGTDSSANQDASKQQDQRTGEPTDRNASSGASGGSGQPGGAVNPQPSIAGEAPKGDDANLEYARKQTDLVLDQLADQLKKKRVDEGLLKDLGWSEAELKKFVERWQQRKAAAEKNDEAGEAAKRELDDALRSLGLRRGQLQQTAQQKDALRDLREGYRGPVPAEYKDRLRAYNQGVSRARPSGE